MKIAVRRVQGREVYWLWCPACDDVVMINDSWSWNGDAERPTFSPSLLSRHTVRGELQVCHSFVTAGIWNYLGDCTHKSAGQQVPMVDLPEWLTA